MLLVIVLVFEGGRLGCSFVDRFTGGLIVCFVEFPLNCPFTFDQTENKQRFFYRPENVRDLPAATMGSKFYQYQDSGARLFYPYFELLGMEQREQREL